MQFCGSRFPTLPGNEPIRQHETYEPSTCPHKSHHKEQKTSLLIMSSKSTMNSMPTYQMNVLLWKISIPKVYCSRLLVVGALLLLPNLSIISNNTFFSKNGTSSLGSSEAWNPLSTKQGSLLIPIESGPGIDSSYGSLSAESSSLDYGLNTSHSLSSIADAEAFAVQCSKMSQSCQATSSVGKMGVFLRTIARSLGVVTLILLILAAHITAMLLLFSYFAGLSGMPW